MTDVEAQIPRVAVIGVGHVGRRVSDRLDGAAELVLFDLAHEDRPSEQLLAACDLGVICVPTPSASDGSCDLSHVETAVRDAPMEHLWIRSTVPPGTTDRLARENNKQICVSPEYFGETGYSPWEDLEDFVVLGGNDDATAVVADLILRTRKPPQRFIMCSAVEAELIKYMENCFLALKVGFVNEFYDLAEAIGANWHTVREGWLADSRISPDHTLVLPHARGFAGKCLPKDLSALLAFSRSVGVSVPVMEGLELSNRGKVEPRIQNSSSPPED